MLFNYLLLICLPHVLHALDDHHDIEESVQLEGKNADPSAQPTWKPVENIWGIHWGGPPSQQPTYNYYYYNGKPSVAPTTFSMLDRCAKGGNMVIPNVSPYSPESLIVGAELCDKSSVPEMVPAIMKPGLEYFSNHFPTKKVSLTGYFTGNCALAGHQWVRVCYNQKPGELQYDTATGNYYVIEYYGKSIFNLNEQRKIFVGEHGTVPVPSDSPYSETGVCPYGLVPSIALCQPLSPTGVPTIQPTSKPTKTPIAAPTSKPTKTPIAAPTSKPTKTPIAAPTSMPNEAPTAAPTSKPTKTPIAAPTSKPNEAPTAAPTKKPIAAPTLQPNSQPTSSPTSEPIATPSPTGEPTGAPTSEPTHRPTTVISHTSQPIAKPNVAPVQAPQIGVGVPTAQPNVAPVVAPQIGVGIPTAKPKVAPVVAPQIGVGVPTAKPNVAPVVAPQIGVGIPTAQPNVAPVLAPQIGVGVPTAKPNVAPVLAPQIGVGSVAPTGQPTRKLHGPGSSKPMKFIAPTGYPTFHPFHLPSNQGTAMPSSMPMSCMQQTCKNYVTTTVTNSTQVAHTTSVSETEVTCLDT